MNFNFETIDYKNSSAHEHLSKKYSIFLRFMAKNDIKGFDWFKNLASFLAMKRRKCGIFFDKSSCAPEFLLSIVSKLKFMNLERSYCFFDFQTITLIMPHEFEF